MNYQLFLQLVKENIERKLGKGYQVHLRAIQRNNGVILDGLSICRISEKVAPTIYLNDFFQDIIDGDSLVDVCSRIYQLYLSNPELPYLDSSVFASFKEVKNRIVFKLMETKSNEGMLSDLPHRQFHDLSVVCYLLMEPKDHGYMTALIHNDHLKSWGISKEQLFSTAELNTRLLLPPVIQPMDDILKTLAKNTMGDEYNEALFDATLLQTRETPEGCGPMFPSLYVLTNSSSVNGAACILYPDVVKSFAESFGQDIMILPSSIHEVLLVPVNGTEDYEEISRMVREINRTEVPLEDRLSNQVYLYTRDSGQIQQMTKAPALIAKEGNL